MLKTYLPEQSGAFAGDTALTHLQIYGGGILNDYQTTGCPLEKNFLRWSGLDFARYVRNGVAPLARRLAGDAYASQFFAMTEPLALLCHPSHDDDKAQTVVTGALLVELHHETQRQLLEIREKVVALTDRRERRASAQTERRVA